MSEREIAKELVNTLMGKVQWELECADKLVLQADRNMCIGKAFAYERSAEMVADRFQVQGK